MSHRLQRRAGLPDHPSFRIFLRAGIVFRQFLLLSGLILASGCTWAVRDQTNETVRDMADHPFDIAPEAAPETAKPPAPPRSQEHTSSSSPAARRNTLVPAVSTDVQTAAILDSRPTASKRSRPEQDVDVHPASWVQPLPEPRRTMANQPRCELHIPPRLPGSEAPEISISKDSAVADQQIRRLYPELPPLPVEPKVQPGPGGKPYTLADFQRLAAANSPALRQAASDVEAAKGNLIQAKTYPNPTIGYMQDSSATNNTGGIQAGFIDQPIITGGKQKLSSAMAQKDLDNAILALKRARSDLSTAVRNAYFTLLVDVETLVVTRALAQFSDEIYRLQTGLLQGTQASPYEPTALRAQTYLNRLAYKQAIASYVYDWKALVATLGLPQLPLSEIAGQVDRFVPYYDYDEVRAYVLRNHTDILTARNSVRKAQYNLKLAQVTPILPNLDVYGAIEHDYLNPPFGTYQTLALGLPIPIWDQNKGNIIAAQGALVRASKEQRRVEVTLTNKLALAYESYRNNLYAMEYYRRNVLPDLVRYYRGVFDRRQIDPSSAFGDLVFAQQNLSTNVTAYIGILGSLWSSVVSVSDFLQTDSLFQTVQQRELPSLPDFTLLRLSPWVGSRNVAAMSPVNNAGRASASPASPLLPPLSAKPLGAGLDSLLDPRAPIQNRPALAEFFETVPGRALDLQSTTETGPVEAR
jgi:cobalt-zinc-cadmium efflux system outer membrane protein